jgi:hypothetical protein
MLTMKQFLALLLVLAAAVSHAQSSTPAQPRSELLRQVAMQKAAPAGAFTPRQLSAEQLAELRRQLSQYSRVAGKGS